MQQEYYERGYYEGLMTGVKRHIWMRDGVTYVGNGTFTLKQATQMIDEDIQKGEIKLPFIQKLKGRGKS